MIRFGAVLISLFTASNAYAAEWIQAAVKDSDDVIVWAGSIANAQSKTYPQTSTFDGHTLKIDRRTVGSAIHVCALFKASGETSFQEVCHVMNGVVANGTVIQNHVIVIMSNNNSSNGIPPLLGGSHGILNNSPMTDLSVDGDSGGGTQTCTCCKGSGDDQTCDTETCSSSQECHCDTTGGSPVASCTG